MINRRKWTRLAAAGLAGGVSLWVGWPMVARGEPARDPGAVCRAADLPARR